MTVEVTSVLTVCTVHLGVDRTCNPTFFDHGSTANTTSNSTVPDAVSNVSFDWKSIASLIIFIGCVLYSR